MNQLFASSGQSTGASTSASVFPINIQGLLSFRIDWFDLFAVQGTFKSLIQHHSSKASILQHSAVFTLTSIHDYWKNHSFDYVDLCGTFQPTEIICRYLNLSCRREKLTPKLYIKGLKIVKPPSFKATAVLFQLG